MGASDGGPAFPVPGLHADESFNGMSLRDYFAAEAVQGIVAGRFYNPGQAEQIAKDAMAIADALIAAREKK